MHPPLHLLLTIVLLLLPFPEPAASGSSPLYLSFYCDENGVPHTRECPASVGSDACPADKGAICEMAHDDCQDFQEASDCRDSSWEFVEGGSHKVMCENGKYTIHHYSNPDCTGNQKKYEEHDGCRCTFPLPPPSPVHFAFCC